MLAGELAETHMPEQDLVEEQHNWVLEELEEPCRQAAQEERHSSALDLSRGLRKLG